MYFLEGLYYQLAGKIREWLGTITGSDIEVAVGRHDQLVGRIAEYCQISLVEAEKRADYLPPIHH